MYLSQHMLCFHEFILQPHIQGSLDHDIAWVNAHLKLPKVHFGNNNKMVFSYQATLEQANDHLPRVSEWLLCISQPQSDNLKMPFGHPPVNNLDV